MTIEPERVRWEIQAPYDAGFTPSQPLIEHDHGRERRRGLGRLEQPVRARADAVLLLPDRFMRIGIENGAGPSAAGAGWTDARRTSALTVSVKVNGRQGRARPCAALDRMPFMAETFARGPNESRRADPSLGRAKRPGRRVCPYRRESQPRIGDIAGEQKDRGAAGRKNNGRDATGSAGVGGFVLLSFCSSAGLLPFIP